MHIHSCYSEDGLSSPSSIIKKIKEKQLTGIAITDHNNCNAWKELIPLGKKENVLIVKGEEIKIKKQGRTVGEVLGYFMNKEIKPAPFDEIIDSLHAQDAVAAIAHPFDSFRNAFLDLDNAIKRVKVIETFNSRCLNNGPNKKAAAFAKAHGLSAIAGSDGHTPWEIGNAFTECNAGNEEELRKAILLGKTKVQGKITMQLIHIFSTIAKLRIIKKL
jgi:predicted metal-dependent phosphoesterase TrpH